MDAPPPYSEIPDNPSPISARTPSLDHGRSTSALRDAGAVTDDLYSLEQSANDYFDSRPILNPHPGETTTCSMNFNPHASRQDIHFPLPEQALLEKDVTVQDWFTFINHLYPQNAGSRASQISAREEAALPEKRPRHGSSNSSISRKPLPPSVGSMSQSSTGRSQEMDDHNRAIDAVIQQWNEGFFLPRGLEIVRERPRSMSNTSLGSGSQEESLADRVARGMEILKYQGFARPSSSSIPSTPETAYSTQPEAIHSTRRTLDDAPSPTTELSRARSHPTRSSHCPFTRHHQSIHPDNSSDISAASASKSKHSRLSMRPKEDTGFPPGTHPQEIALYKAVSKGDKTMTKVLLQSGVSPNVGDNSGASALYRSVARGESSIVKLLIEHPIDPNTRTTSGDTPLYCAVSRGDTSVVRFLLMLSVDVDAKNAKGKSPLVKAVQRGDSSIVSMLLDRNANISLECNGVTPLSLAAEKGHSKIAKLMVKSQERVVDAPWAS